MESLEYNPKVNKVYFTGTLEKVIEQIKDFENHFKLEPLTSPNIPNQFALVNTYDGKNSFYAFVSRHYEILEAWKSLETFMESMKEQIKSIEKDTQNESFDQHFTVKVHISRNISAEIFLTYEDSQYTTSKIFHYINSYDKKLKETIIFAPFLLSFSYVHRKSGLNKHGFTKLLELFSMHGLGTDYNTANQLGEKTALETFIKQTKVTEKEFEKLITITQIPINKLLVDVFGVDRQILKDMKEKNLYREAYRLFSERNSNTLASLVILVDKLYKVLVATNKYDKASFIYAKVSDFVTKKFINAEKALML